jgi:hypothetical protein
LVVAIQPPDFEVLIFKTVMSQVFTEDKVALEGEKNQF